MGTIKNKEEEHDKRRRRTNLHGELGISPSYAPHCVTQYKFPAVMCNVFSTEGSRNTGESENIVIIRLGAEFDTQKKDKPWL